MMGEALLNALLAFNKDKASLNKMETGGFAPAKDSDFNVIRDLQAYLPK
jgi:hypothetical protein